MRHLIPFLVLASSIAHAEIIPINNPSFEANFASPGTFPVLVPTGWTLVDPNNIVDFSNDAVGVVNPTGTTFFQNGVPNGSNAALIYLGQQMGQGAVSLSQVLSTPLRRNTRYVLRVEVGNIASGYGAPPYNYFFNLQGFPGYCVQLLAGGQVIAEDNNTLDDLIPEGTFRTTTLAVTIGKSHARLGQNLEVRVTNLNHLDSPQNPGIEVDFDHVRLDAFDGAVTPKGHG